METRIINKQDLAKVIDGLISAGTRTAAPVKVGDMHLFQEISSSAEAVFDYFLARRSSKEFLFPQTEPIFSFAKQKDTVTVHPVDMAFPRTVVFGLRPCDAAGPGIMDALFAWDYEDKFWFNRRAQTTFVSMTCAQADHACFCTSVGLAPDAANTGADLHLTLLEDGQGYFVEAPTEKGRKLVSEFPSLFKPATDSAAAARGSVGEKAKGLITRKLDLSNVKQWLDTHFTDELWERLSAKCIGCGACAFECPTCHCFDFQDEATLEGGVRCKNWDSCCIDNFTLHASGHNPRNVQHKRYRQRIMHKFKYYIDKFGKTLCTGCGRCSRQCPVTLDIAEVLENIAAKAASGS